MHRIISRGAVALAALSLAACSDGTGSGAGLGVTLAAEMGAPYVVGGGLEPARLACDVRLTVTGRGESHVLSMFAGATVRRFVGTSTVPVDSVHVTGGMLAAVFGNDGVTGGRSLSGTLPVEGPPGFRAELELRVDREGSRLSSVTVDVPCAPRPSGPPPGGDARRHPLPRLGPSRARTSGWATAPRRRRGSWR